MEGQGRDLGHPQLQPHDASGLRISDADRHRVSEVLREAAGEGRLDLDELEERLEAAFSAKTYADLVPLTADLPVHRDAPTAAPRPVPAGPCYPRTVAIMSESKRLGPWTVEDGHTALALMGSVTLDLREAHFAGREVSVVADAVMGEVKIVVGPEVVVVVEGLGIMGEFGEQRARVEAAVGPDSPVLRVKGVALMGSVTVRRRPSRKRLPAR